jgi:hypothetical protein
MNIIMPLLAIAGIVAIILGARRLFNSGMDRVDSFNAAHGHRMVHGKIKPAVEHRNNMRPFKARIEEEHAVRDVWVPRIRHEEKKAAVSWQNVGRRLLAGKSADKASARAIRYEDSARIHRSSLLRELGIISDRYSDPTARGNPRVGPSGRTLGGIRRAGHGPAIPPSSSAKKSSDRSWIRKKLLG